MVDRRPPSVAPRRPAPSAVQPPRAAPVQERQALQPRQGPQKPQERQARRPGQERAAAPVGARVKQPPRREPARVDTVTLRLQARLAERKRTERRRALVAASRWVAAGAVVIGIVAAVAMSPLFALDSAKIELQGVSNEIDPVAVTSLLAEYEGESLALLNTRGITHDLEAMVGVRDATVERVWPAGLRVTLVARHPVAAVAGAEGYILLDADAVNVGVSEAAPEGLPVVDVPLGDERILDAVLEVIRSLPSDLLARVGAVAAPTEDSVSFTLRDGPRIEWGSAEESALKAQVLTVMLASEGATTAAVIDLSAPTLPITKSS